MSNKRQGRVFAVVIMAALGLMAMMVSTASAQWLEVYSKDGVETPKEQEILKNLKVEVGEHTADGTLDVPSKNLLILCDTITGNDLLLIAKSLTLALGSVVFSTCSVFSNEVLQKNCKVDDVTAGGEALLIKHTNGRTYVLFEPDEKPEFATILFLGELCALPEVNKVSGSLVAECVNVEGNKDLSEYDCLTPKSVHGLREALNATTLFPTDGLKYGAGAVAANVLGVATATLDTGAVWSGHV